MTFADDDRDVGRVITGSSNFTQAGLLDNLEFNVELKNRSDYEFALCKFNELWAVILHQLCFDVVICAGKQASFVEVVITGGVSKCAQTGCLVMNMVRIHLLHR